MKLFIHSRVTVWCTVQLLQLTAAVIVRYTGEFLCVALGSLGVNPIELL